jgi:hypothetical protein
MANKVIVGLRFIAGPPDFKPKEYANDFLYSYGLLLKCRHNNYHALHADLPSETI